MIGAGPRGDVGVEQPPQDSGTCRNSRATSSLLVFDVLWNVESSLGDADASLGRLLGDRNPVRSRPAVPGNGHLVFLPLFYRFHQAPA